MRSFPPRRPSGTRWAAFHPIGWALVIVAMAGIAIAEWWG